MDILEVLKKQKSEMEEYLIKLQERQKDYKNLPHRGLRAASHRSGFQYYIREDGPKYRYVCRSKLDTVKKMIQRDYEENLIRILQKDLKKISRLIDNCQLSSLAKEYDRLPEGKRVFVDPLVINDQMYVERWYKKYPGGKNTYQEAGQYTTDRGELVRSKSEKIIADMFYRNAIPYQYEPEIVFRDGTVVYPDFALLNVRKRKTFFWEHLGMISNEEYAVKNWKKIMRYEENGIFLSMDLIISEESSDGPLNLRLIKEKIDKYLK